MDHQEATSLNSYETSIFALRPQTKNLISALLNPPKIFLSDMGRSRDWYGLAELIGIGGEQMPHIKCNPDPTSKLLTIWHNKNKEGATIKKLLMHLEEMDRFDVIDDTRVMLEEDIKLFNQTKTAIPETLDTLPEYPNLTQDDLNRYSEGLGPQLYDAFILFANEDIEFATEIIDNLEKYCKLKVCVKDRDLIPGVFEHESVIKLIAERCNRLVAVFSPAFFASSSNKFFLSFAQSLGIEQRRRKIIPCLNSFCKIPPEYSCYFMLNRQRTDFANFWERLRDAIKAPQTNVMLEPRIQRSRSQKISTHDETKTSLHLKVNTLKPKKDVKFISMENLSYLEHEDTQITQNLNSISNHNSLSNISIDNKKRRSKLDWLKKMLPRKTSKCNGNVIGDVPKPKIFGRSDKRKVALAN